MTETNSYPRTPLFRVDVVMCAHGFERDGERLTIAYGPTRRQAKRAALRPGVFSRAVDFAPSRWSRCWADVELDTAEAIERGEGREHPYLSEEILERKRSAMTVGERGVW